MRSTLPNARARAAALRGRALRVCFALAIAASAPSCSYRLAGDWGAGATTVSIVTLENDSVEAGVERIVSRALRKEFERRGGPRLVGDPNAADLIIRGSVLPLYTTSNSFSTVALAIEYQVRMTLSLRVEDRAGAAIAIGPYALSETEFYLASADAEASRKNRQEALRRIADVLAARIHDAIGLHFSASPQAKTEEEGSTS